MVTTLTLPDIATASSVAEITIPVTAPDATRHDIPAHVRLRLSATQSALTGIHLYPFAGETDSSIPVTAAENECGAILTQAVEELSEYFAGTRREFSVPLAPQGTAFQQKVWAAMNQIPYGQTRSYWWIAVRLGDPHAVRAVGRANGANPIPIIQPCHRVVRQDRSLGGFSGGLDWKRLLLRIEGLDPDAISG